MRSYLFALLGLALFVQACNSETPPPPPEETGVVGIPIDQMDQSADPCGNFWHYANGSWLNENPVPSTENKWGSFNVLNDDIRAKLRKILEDASANSTAEKGTAEQQLGDFYYTAMDTNKLEQDGLSPLNEELAKIDQLNSKEELMALMAHHKSHGIGGPFSFYVGVDALNSSQHIMYFGQSGLGLPDRDYYFREDEKSADIREAYMQHVQKLFMMLNYDEAFALESAQKVMGFETALADASMDNVTRRDVEKTTNKFAFAEFSGQHKDLGLDRFLTAVGVDLPDSVIVSQPDFFNRVSALYAQEKLETWKIYLRWNLVNATAHLLNAEMDQANFDFYSTKLNGTKAMQPRWKRAQSQVNSSMGELLGQAFVKESFTPETKQKAEQMVDNLIASLRERLDALEWMGDSTKVEARAKIAKLRVKIGYPDVWKDWSTMNIDRSSYLNNVLAANKISFDRNIQKMGQPIDKDEWLMSPQMVNAYYHPLLNEIVFPAAILQPPFYDPNADDALNYGGIGAVIGHELTHGFDDQGNKFDADGNVRNWWTEEDYTNFRERADKVVEQFNGYEALDSLYVNGSLTLGENIADLGGLTIAYQAYMKSLEGKEKKEIDGLSPEQRFFVSWGQVWKTNYTDESMTVQVQTNPHSPAEFRVIGPLANIPEFYEAFGCKPTPEEEQEMVKIW